MCLLDVAQPSGSRLEINPEKIKETAGLFVCILELSSVEEVWTKRKLKMAEIRKYGNCSHVLLFAMSHP